MPGEQTRAASCLTAKQTPFPSLGPLMCFLHRYFERISCKVPGTLLDSLGLWCCEITSGIGFAEIRTIFITASCKQQQQPGGCQKGISWSQSAFPVGVARQVSELKGALHEKLQERNCAAGVEQLKMARNLHNLILLASNLIAMASLRPNQMAMTSNPIAMASNLIAMAPTLVAMTSNLYNSFGLQPNSYGLQPNSYGLQPKSSDGLHPSSNGLQPVLQSNSDGLHPSSYGLHGLEEAILRESIDVGHNSHLMLLIKDWFLGRLSLHWLTVLELP